MTITKEEAKLDLDTARVIVDSMIARPPARALTILQYVNTMTIMRIVSDDRFDETMDLMAQRVKERAPHLMAAMKDDEG